MLTQGVSNRRQFLRVTVAGALGTAVLAACGGSAPASLAAPSTPKPGESAKPAETPKPATVQQPPAQAGVGQQLKPTLVPGGGGKAVPKPSIKMEGDLVLWHNWGTAQGGGLGMLDLIAEFSRLYPQVKVTNVYDAGPDKYVPAFASGNVPDSLLVGSDLASLAPRGVLTELDSFITRDNFDLKSHYAIAVQQTQWNGKTYGMTHHPDGRCYWMAQDIFKEADLDPEKGPTSWDDILAWGKKMSRQEGGRYVRMGFVPSWTASPWPTQIMQANGVTLLSDDGRKVAFNTDPAVESLDWALRVTNEVAGGRDNVVAFEESNKSGATGNIILWMYPQMRIGSMLHGTWGYSQVSILNPTMKCKNVAFPGGPSAKGQEFVFSGNTAMVIPKGARHVDMAWEWLHFMGSEEGGYLIQARTSDVAGNIAAATDPRILDNNIGRKQILPLLAKANRLVSIWSPVASQYDAEMTRMGDRILLKQMTPKQALDDAAKNVQKALDDYWAGQKN